MSDEQNLTPAPTEAAPEATPEAPSEAALDTSSGDESLYTGWDGELESLDGQEWFSGLQGEVQQVVRGGYKQARDNVTRALHAKSAELAGVRRNLEGLQGSLREKASQYASEIEKLQQLMQSDEGNSDERVAALRSGFDSQVADFQKKMEAYESQNRELFDDNRQLLTAYERAKGETAGIRDHFNRELASFRHSAQQAYGQMQQERDYYRSQMQETNQRQLDQEFDSEFTYLAKDEARRGEAMNAYYGALQAHIQRNNGRLFPDEQWEQIERVTAAQVKALYPETNPAPAKLPEAEALAQAARSSGTSAYVPARSSNKGTMF